MSKTSLGVVDPKFVGFLRATLGMMAGTNVIDKEDINLEFWTSWTRRFYNVRAYDATKEDLENDIDLEFDQINYNSPQTDSCVNVSEDTFHGASLNINKVFIKMQNEAGGYVDKYFFPLFLSLETSQRFIRCGSNTHQQAIKITISIPRPRPRRR